MNRFYSSSFLILATSLTLYAEEFIIRLENSSDVAKTTQVAWNDGKVKKSVNVGAFHYILLDTELTQDEVQRHLKSIDTLGVVEKNQSLRFLSQNQTNDPYFSRQWNLSNAVYPEYDIGYLAVDLPSTISPATVAVIDTGLAWNQPELLNAIWNNPGEIPFNGLDDDGNGWVDDQYGWNFENDNPYIYDTNSHGTLVSSILAATPNNQTGIAGVASNARIMALKVQTLFEAIQALDYVSRCPVPIINISWEIDTPSIFLEEALAHTHELGILVVVAVSNDFNCTYPACYSFENLIRVGGYGPDGSLISQNTYADLVAPATRIPALGLAKQYFYFEDFQNSSQLPSLFHQEGIPFAVEIDQNFSTSDNRVLCLQTNPQQEQTSFLEFDVPAFQTSYPVFFSLALSGKTNGSETLIWQYWNGSMWQDFLDMSGLYGFGSGEPIRYDLALDFLPNERAIKFRLSIQIPQYDEVFSLKIDEIGLFVPGSYGQPNTSSDVEYVSGNSFAAPHVAGVAALLLGANLNMSVQELKLRLMATGQPLNSQGFSPGGRKLNAARAINPTLLIGLDDSQIPESLLREEGIKLNWFNFQEPNASAHLYLSQNHNILLEIPHSGNANGAMTWFPPFTGSGFTIQAHMTGFVFESHPFELRDKQIIKIEDPLFKLYLLEYDLNSDFEIDELEAKEIRKISAANLEIKSISGIEKLTNLRSIDFSGTGLQETPDLSKLVNLEFVDFSSTKLSKLGALPDNILFLNLRNNSLVDLTALPSALNYLNLSFNHLTRLPSLPDRLSILWVQGNDLLELPALPRGLNELNVSNNRLAALPPLPPRLLLLNCSNNNLASMPALPKSLIDLSLFSNQITCLPDLPRELSGLNLGRNPLTPPDLSMFTKLQTLNLSNLNLNELPLFPVSNLQTLDLSGNHFYDCKTIQYLRDLIIPGTAGFLLLSSDLDGLVMGHDEINALVSCPEQLFPAEIHVQNAEWKTDNRVMLDWRMDGNQGVWKFVIRINDKRVFATSDTHFLTPPLSRNSKTKIEIIAENIQGFVTSAITTPLVLDDTPYRYVIPRFSASSTFGLAFQAFMTKPSNWSLHLMGVRGHLQTLTGKLNGNSKQIINQATFDAHLLASARWLLLESETPLSFVGIEIPNGRLTSLSSAQPARQGVLPATTRVGQSFKFIFINPFDSDVSLAVELRDLKGEFVAERALQVSPYGFIEEDAFSLFGYASGGSLFWKCDSNIYASSFFSDAQSVSVAPFTSASMSYYLPEVIKREVSASNEYPFHSLWIQNPNRFATSISLTCYAKNGRFLNETFMELGPYETRWYATELLFHEVNALDFQVEVKSRLPVHLSYSLEQGSSDSRARDFVSVSTTPAEQYLITHFPNPQKWHLSFSLYNPGSKTLEIQFKDNMGRSIQITLPPRSGQILELPSTFSAAENTIVVSSAQGAFVLNGWLSSEMLKDRCSYSPIAWIQNFKLDFKEF